MKTANFISDIKEAIDVALFKHTAMHHVAGDKNKNISALLILIIAAILSALGIKYIGYLPLSLGEILGMIIYQVVASIIGIFILSLISKSIFKGQAKHDAFFRVMAFAAIVTWISVIPNKFVGLIVAVWGLALVFVVLKVIHKLTTGGALGAILVSAVALILLGKLLAPTFGSFGAQGGISDLYEDGFKMNFKSDDGAGSMEMEDGVMRIEGPDGEIMEIEIPDFE